MASAVSRTGNYDKNLVECMSLLIIDSLPIKGSAVHSQKTGIILLNMGGPDTLDDVKPFLLNLFSDREIIKLGPSFLQGFLARIISHRRAPKSKAIYQKIGGGSPLKAITSLQAEALSRELESYGDYTVSFAMRYWPPFADSVLQQMQAENVSNIIALTLYPHYSKATTGSSVNHLQASHKDICPEIPLRIISSWPAEPSYIQAVAENIMRGVSTFTTNDVTIVYSAHSLPTSFITEGDPYVKHINQTIKAVEKITGKTGKLCYQSRSGPVEWLSPATPDMIRELAQQGCSNILMVPISFVSDHVETLYEIGMQYRDLARDLGMELKPCESLNVQPLFIKALRDLVLKNTD